nr:FAD-dependent oxidoreductase [Lysinibacillus timonensis]
MTKVDVIIVGSGLAGLTTALELSENGKSVIVLEKKNFIGGRTSSWDENGMLVESGFHRHIGYYEALPKILKKAGVDVDKIVQWEENVDIRIRDKKDTAVFGISPVFGPIDSIRGFLGNNEFLSVKDKVSILRFFSAGFLEYKTNPDDLDRYSVKEYAEKHEVSKDAYDYLLIPLTAGIFFLPPERYSAKVFFGLFYPGLIKFYKIRIGAYLGGMTEVLAKPIVKKIEDYGGVIRTSTKVKGLLSENNKIIGVELEDDTKMYANTVVVASDLGSAKRILREFEGHQSLSKLFQLPTMPAVTIQMEFSEAILPYDRTTFAPLTSIASFTEQSRTTFTHVPGRLSIILTPPEQFIDMEENEILKHVQQDAQSLGMDLVTHLIDYRIIRHSEDFYCLSPNYDWMRPDQKTDIPGLVLAGDYTRQPFFATMEGAVLSGLEAARIINEE